MSGGLASLMVIVGPILLAIAIIWAYTHNRITRRQARDQDAAVRDSYKGDPIDRSGS